MDLFERIAKLVLRARKVVTLLEVHPKFDGSAEETGKPQGRVSRDSAPRTHDLIGRIKGRTSTKLFETFPELKKRY